MNVLLEKGDHVIVQFPGYQSLYEIARSIGCKVTKWTVRHEDDWELDLEALKRSITKKTKAIVINLPHNPTGYIPSKRKFKEIVEIAKRDNIHIFCDEVYRYLEYKDKDRLPSISDVYSKGVSLGVMSKTFGLAGLRIGWIATKDRALLDRMASFKDYTSICSSAPSEFLSTIALGNKQRLVKRNVGIINRNLRLLDRFFSKYDGLFEWVRPKAGSIAFPKILFDEDSEKFCIDVVNKKGVLLMPSTKFDFGNKHFRVGFGRKNMPLALKKLEEYVEEELL
jgi:aspartate/methionine/tyrosine aminotransferase